MVQSAASQTTPSAEAKAPPPRERILAAASDLFYRHGIRAVGVDAVAEAAGTNKMTLYRHFESKDALVAAYLAGLAAESDGPWDALERAYPGDSRAQLMAWLKEISSHLGGDSRGCALANAAVELPEIDHPARRVIEANKAAQRDRLAALCKAAGAREPDLLADEIFLLIEGARISLQSVGPTGPGSRLLAMAERLVRDSFN